MTDDELIVESLDRRAVSQRRRRFRQRLPQQLGVLPDEWRELLTRWVRHGGNSRWDTLARDAGNNRVALAEQLREWLLREGWVSIVEQRQHGGWWPHSLEMRNLPQLRAALGLKDAEAEAERWHTLRSELVALCPSALIPLLSALDALPPTRALKRADLVSALARWQADARQGTQRDFALFARGGTKSLGSADWQWLETHLDLADFGIERHTPLLFLAASITLHLPQGSLDLSVHADFAALTPATLARATHASAAPTRWVLVENRTSFEKQARQREPDTGVIWLPGFPPGWWRDAVRQLLMLAPAPAAIACDPDPAGIQIALQAAAIWETAQLDWKPLQMNADTLMRLPHHQPLNDWDRALIAQLAALTLPFDLAGLLDAMQANNKKGEQEGVR